MKNKRHIIRIALSALFIAVSIILMRLFVFPAGPTPFRLSLGNVPIILGGILLGPIYGVIIGFGADIIGANLFPSGTFLVFPLISSILYGLIPGLFFMLLKKIRTKNKFPLVYPLVIVLFAIVLIYFSAQSSIKYPFSFSGDQAWVLTPLSKTITIVVAVIVAVLLLGGLFLTEKKLKQKDTYQNVLPSDFALTIIVTELLVDVIYTPIWKNLYFGMPYMFSLFMHILILLSLIFFKTTLINLIVYSFKKSNIQV